jgi:hypothetical protein
MGPSGIYTVSFTLAVKSKDNAGRSLLYFHSAMVTPSVFYCSYLSPISTLLAQHNYLYTARSAKASTILYIPTALQI